MRSYRAPPTPWATPPSLPDGFCRLRARSELSAGKALSVDDQSLIEEIADTFFQPRLIAGARPPAPVRRSTCCLPTATADAQQRVLRPEGFQEGVQGSMGMTLHRCRRRSEEGTAGHRCRSAKGRTDTLPRTGARALAASVFLVRDRDDEGAALRDGPREVGGMRPAGSGSAGVGIE